MIQASAGINPSRMHPDSLGQSESGVYSTDPPPCLTLTSWSIYGEGIGDET